jgi:hypothetical protein
MCADHDCPSRQKCWRYTAPPGYWQAYQDMQRVDGEDCCKWYWPLEPGLIKPKKRLSVPYKKH